jgi:hypothetical protein
MLNILGIDAIVLHSSGQITEKDKKAFRTDCDVNDIANAAQAHRGNAQDDFRTLRIHYSRFGRTGR